MKRRNSFLLREVATRQVIVPLGRAAQDFPGMLSLNATGAYLWQLLEQEHSFTPSTRIPRGNSLHTSARASSPISA